MSPCTSTRRLVATKPTTTANANSNNEGMSWAGLPPVLTPRRVQPPKKKFRETDATRMNGGTRRVASGVSRVKLLSLHVWNRGTRTTTLSGHYHTPSPGPGQNGCLWRDASHLELSVSVFFSRLTLRLNGLEGKWEATTTTNCHHQIRDGQSGSGCNVSLFFLSLLNDS